jgi:hypothetical protein
VQTKVELLDLAYQRHCLKNSESRFKRFRGIINQLSYH